MYGYWLDLVLGIPFDLSKDRLLLMSQGEQEEATDRGVVFDSEATKRGIVDLGLI